jgi:predicted histone-like DNA-binding protein
MFSKVNQMWYPRLVVKGKPADTQTLATRISAACSVTPSDVHAVIRALPTMMAQLMAEGKAVHLDGLGSFRFTGNASGKGVATPEEVNSKQFTSLRVRFVPETVREGLAATRALTDTPVEFEEYVPSDKTSSGGSGSGGGSKPSNPGGGSVDE